MRQYAIYKQSWSGEIVNAFRLMKQCGAVVDMDVGKGVAVDLKLFGEFLKRCSLCARKCSVVLSRGVVCVEARDVYVG